MISFRRRAVAAASAALLALGLTGCDSAGPEHGADLEDVAEEDYFDGTKYLDEQVTISAEVSDVINPRAFELGGHEYGDESLLVLYAEGADVHKRELVQATGTVRQFRYADYLEPYGLVDEGRYDAFRDEEFLVAERVEVSAPPRG
ncbi:hypothetical protein [Amycolatopsis aidingensis]|uniref:hypothetical protein n=1 Tax=Amycolatopsis aidingensis TaxID=2842453 RepID=UPI001C0CACBD|nr:hypothetical protein [Amycolatopsis aidingensis]